MKDFSDYLKIIFDNEFGNDSDGGYTNDPIDAGGETKWGISKRAHPNLDIKNLTIEQASEIYKKEYWDTLHIDGISNEDLKLQIFDMGVNAGTHQAISLLQNLVGTYKDGVCGSKTIQATNSCKGDLLMEYKKARVEYYYNLTKVNPNNKRFLAGWLSRVDKCTFNQEGS